MNTLPEEIVTTILIYCIDYKIQNGIYNINNIKLINKYIYSIINTPNFWVKLYKYYDILEHYKKNSNLYHIKSLIDYNMLKYKAPKEIINIFTMNGLYKIPILKNRLYINNLIEYNDDDFTHSIMRGYDYNNNFFIIFKYKSLIDQQNLIEMIYLNVQNNLRKIWTTCGSGNSIYFSIFLSKNNKDFLLFNDFTNNYIKRLLKGNAGLIYEDKLNPMSFYEDTINKLILVK